MKIGIFIVVLSCVLNVGCSDNESEDPMQPQDEMVFGVYYNFCVGNCWHLFKIENGSIYSDDYEHPSQGEPIRFQNTPLSQDIYEKARVLTKIPEAILLSDIEVYGCPDCADQGGYFLEFPSEGGMRQVNLDTRYSNFEDTDIVAYLDQMSAILAELVP